MLVINQRVGALEAQLLDGLRAVGKVTEAVNGKVDTLRAENVELKTG